MRPGEKEPDRAAIVSTLRRIAENPSAFSLEEVSCFTTMAADLLDLIISGGQRPVKISHPEGQRTVYDENPGVIRTKGRPSVYD